ncbi:MAG: DUF5919 domain-containing protein [Carbonactinosporaceae bacterium]
MNDTLRRSLAHARLNDVEVASRLGVDPKTVRRWVSGRLPYPRHRWALTELLGVDEGELWPDTRRVVAHRDCGTLELLAAYPHRWAVPRDVWRHLLGGAEREIGVLVYSGLFLAEDVGAVPTLAAKARADVRVRLLLGDPESPQVAQRGADEGIGEAMAARIRIALVLLESLFDLPGVEVRLHDATLYNSIYYADDEMLVNTHVYGAVAADAPVLHLRDARAGASGSRDKGGMIATYRDSFERVWAAAKPVS